MKKYIITEKNMSEVAGLINKFFRSCYEKNQWIYDWSNSGKLTQEKHCYYPSKPSKEPCATVNKDYNCIEIEYPVGELLVVGSVVYFNGGNRLIYRSCPNGKYLDFIEREYVKKLVVRKS